MDAKELLTWTRNLLENLEMRPDEPGFSGHTVHLSLLDAVREWLAKEGGKEESTFEGLPWPRNLRCPQCHAVNWVKLEHWTSRKCGGCLAYVLRQEWRDAARADDQLPALDETEKKERRE